VYLFYKSSHGVQRFFLGVIQAVVDKFVGCIRQLGPIKYSRALFPEIIAMEKSDRDNAVIPIELHDVLTQKMTQVLGTHDLVLIITGKRNCGYNQKDNYKSVMNFSLFCVVFIMNFSPFVDFEIFGY